MEAIQVQQAIDELGRMKEINGIFDVAYRTTFDCYWRNKRGEDKKVTIEIFDRGVNEKGLRYYCRATSEDGEHIQGDAADSITSAIDYMMLHWGKFNK